MGFLLVFFHWIFLSFFYYSVQLHFVIYSIAEVEPNARQHLTKGSHHGSADSQAYKATIPAGCPDSETDLISFAFDNSRDQRLPKKAFVVSVDSGVTLGLHGSTYK